MMKFYILLIFFSACAVTSDGFYQDLKDVPERPLQGFNRSILFPKYLDFQLGTFTKSPMYRQLQTRCYWKKENFEFRKKNSMFDVDLIAFNQLEKKSFSWQERILFADALDLIIFVVNQPEFLEEMKKKELVKPFYNNSQTKIVLAEEIVRHIRSSSLKFYLGKDYLEKNVLAQATVGGINNMIWFRQDTDYQKEYGVFELAIILFHEMTHNLGYLHESNVPYGIQDPFLRVIERTSVDKVHEFISMTPHFESEFLIKVRDFQSLKQQRSILIQKDYIDDIGKNYLNNL